MRTALLVVTAIVLLLALARAPQFITQSRLREQRQTMAEIRTLATALEARATDTNEYPEARSLDELARLLEPKYVPKMPRVDAWGYPLRYEAWRRPGEKVDNCYGITSPGADGRFEKVSARAVCDVFNRARRLRSRHRLCERRFCSVPEDWVKDVTRRRSADTQ